MLEFCLRSSSLIFIRILCIEKVKTQNQKDKRPTQEDKLPKILFVSESYKVEKFNSTIRVIVLKSSPIYNV